jgi:hypothetical protein
MLQKIRLHDWSFSATAEFVVALLLALVLAISTLV